MKATIARYSMLKQQADGVSEVLGNIPMVGHKSCHSLFFKLY